MKQKTYQLLRAAFFTLAGSAFATATLSAATVVNPSSGDVILGFRASGGQGSSTSYLVDLGQASPFVNATPGTTITLGSIGDTGADLLATYGSGWSNRSDLFWGVFGRTTSASPTLYASEQRTDINSQSTSLPALDQTARSSTSSAISSVLTGTNGFRGSTATVNSTVATLQNNFSGAASYNYQVATAGTTDFGSLSQWGSIEGTFGNGASGTALDLYRINSTGTQYLGDFTINSSGALSFTAVPEPSLPMLGAVRAILLLGRRQRGISI
jgi:hypothetical protein